MKVAIVYDRVNKWGGAERVLLALHEMFPKAPLFTSVYDEVKAPWARAFPNVYTSFLQKLPFTKSLHEFLGTFMPLAFEQFSFEGYDLVISVTSEAAKGIVTKPDTLHLCYMLTPTRYLWSHYDLYFRNPLLRLISLPVVNYLRYWEKVASSRPDEIIAISKAVQARIKKYYGISSEVIFPPVNLGTEKKDAGKYYLVVSRLDFGYKKVELVIDTFNKLKKPLIIVGTGREITKYKLKSKRNVKFVEKVTDEELAKYYLSAKALIMPQEEDFGIVAVEAQSYGTPVIAYGKGGVLDTVINGETGILFDRQNTESLTSAIEKFEQMSFNSKQLAAHARKFSKEVFKRRLQESLIRAYRRRGRRYPSLA